MSIVHKNILISGKVQGVYFRASAKHEADKLGIKGFVANKPDGKVYLETEGDQVSLEQFIEWCKLGPASAEVKTVDVSNGHIKNFTDFRIMR